MLVEQLENRLLLFSPDGFDPNETFEPGPISVDQVDSDDPQVAPAGIFSAMNASSGAEGEGSEALIISTRLTGLDLNPLPNLDGDAQPEVAVGEEFLLQVELTDALPNDQWHVASAYLDVSGDFTKVATAFQEEQTLTIDATAESGTFSLQYDDSTSTEIDIGVLLSHDRADRADIVRQAIESLDGISHGDVEVKEDGYLEYMVVFTGNLANRSIPELVPTSVDLRDYNDDPLPVDAVTVTERVAANPDEVDSFNSALRSASNLVAGNGDVTEGEEKRLYRFASSGDRNMNPPETGKLSNFGSAATMKQLPTWPWPFVLDFPPGTDTSTTHLLLAVRLMATNVGTVTLDVGPPIEGDNYYPDEIALSPPEFYDTSNWRNLFPDQLDQVVFPAAAVVDIVEPRAIHGVKYEDVEGNGLGGGDDIPSNASTILLYRDRDDDGGFEPHGDDNPPLDSRVPDVDGTYSFGSLDPGRYFVTETPNAGWIQTGGGDDFAGGVDYYTVSIVDNEGVIGKDFANQRQPDFGDAPAPYPTLRGEDGARHGAVGPMLGANRDAEVDGTHSADADADDNTGIPDDEDGVDFTNVLIPGQMTTVEVAASDAGKLDAWIDFNDDGDWADPGEQIFVNRSLPTGVYALSFQVPISAPYTNETYARFRISSDGGLSYHGPASDGEVEDYDVAILSHSPIAVDDEFDVIRDSQDTPLDVLGNDIPSASGRTYLAITAVGLAGTAGTATIDRANTPMDYTDDAILYTTPSGVLAPDSFTYTIQDVVTGATDTATVSITITPVSDATPDAVDDVATVSEAGVFNSVAGDTLDSGSASVLGNDTGLADVPIVASLVTPPLYATGPFTLNADGTFVYEHNGSENFSDSFTYQIEDNDGQTDTATVSIAITRVSDTTPDAVDDLATVNEGETTTTVNGSLPSVLGNDTGLADVPIAVSLMTPPLYATASFTLNADGTFVYEHNDTENFSDSFTYQIEDNDGQTDTATVTVTVNPKNDVPTIDTSAVVTDTAEEDETVVLEPIVIDDIDAANDPEWRGQVTLSAANGLLTLPKEVRSAPLVEAMGLPTQSVAHVVYVIDVSGSTSLPFGGTPVGDANNDGTADTILDGEIAGFLALNNQLVNQFGTNANVSVVEFHSWADCLDMDPVTAGKQLATEAHVDAGGTGERDVEEVLKSLQITGGTNFEAALQETINVLQTLNTDPALTNVIFMSDGSDFGPYDDEVLTLQPLASNIRAFGAGAGASIASLQRIDPNAQIFTDSDGLITALSGGVVVGGGTTLQVDGRTGADGSIEIDPEFGDGGVRDENFAVNFEGLELIDLDGDPATTGDSRLIHTTGPNDSTKWSIPSETGGLMIDLGAVYTIDVMQIWNFNATGLEHYGPGTFDLYVSSDGTDMPIDTSTMTKIVDDAPLNSATVAADPLQYFGETFLFGAGTPESVPVELDDEDGPFTPLDNDGDGVTDGNSLTGDPVTVTGRFLYFGDLTGTALDSGHVGLSEIQFYGSPEGSPSVTYVQSNGLDDSTIVIEGTVEALNAALSAVQYRSNQDWNSGTPVPVPDQIDVTINDLGNTELVVVDGDLEVTESVTVTVHPRQDPPEIVSVAGTLVDTAVNPIDVVEDEVELLPEIVIDDVDATYDLDWIGEVTLSVDHGTITMPDGVVMQLLPRDGGPAFDAQSREFNGSDLPVPPGPDAGNPGNVFSGVGGGLALADLDGDLIGDTLIHDSSPAAPAWQLDQETGGLWIDLGDAYFVDVMQIWNFNAEGPAGEDLTSYGPTTFDLWVSETDPANMNKVATGVTLDRAAFGDPDYLGETFLLSGAGANLLPLELGDENDGVTTVVDDNGDPSMVTGRYLFLGNMTGTANDGGHLGLSEIRLYGRLASTPDVRIAIGTGVDDRSVTVRGSRDALNELMDATGGTPAERIRYLNDPHYNNWDQTDASEALTITINDLGNTDITGTSAALTDQVVVPISVEPIQDRPGVDVSQTFGTTVDEDDRVTLAPIVVSDVDADSGRGAEVQLLTFGGTITGGWFRINYDGNPSPAITWSPTASTLVNNIQTALDQTFGGGNTVVASLSATEYTISFTGNLNANLQQITTDGSLLIGTAPTVTASTISDGAYNEVQRFTAVGGAGDSFTLSYEGIAGAAINGPYAGLTAAAVETNLETIGALIGNVTVIGANGGPFTIVFGNALAGTNVSQLEVSSTAGDTSSVSTVAHGRTIYDPNWEGQVTLTVANGVITLPATSRPDQIVIPIGPSFVDGRELDGTFDPITLEPIPENDIDGTRDEDHVVNGNGLQPTAAGMLMHNQGLNDSSKWSIAQVDGGLMIDLGDVYTIDVMQIWNFNVPLLYDYGPQTFDLWTYTPDPADPLPPTFDQMETSLMTQVLDDVNLPRSSDAANDPADPTDGYLGETFVLSGATTHVIPLELGDETGGPDTNHQNELVKGRYLFFGDMTGTTTAGGHVGLSEIRLYGRVDGSPQVIFENGNGIQNSTVSIRGSLGDLNATLDGIVYEPNPDYNSGPANVVVPYSIEVHISDLGNTGNPAGPLENEATVAITVNRLSDSGDAPSPYSTSRAADGAYHVALGPTLGVSRDWESDGQPTVAADGDDVTGTPDDEDGVTFGSIQVGQLDANVTVNVQNAPDGAKLDAWIDFDGDGSWDGRLEQIADSVTVHDGDNAVTFDVPSSTIDGATYARFRLSTVGGLDPGGFAADGEVEDYQVTILPSATTAVYDNLPHHPEWYSGAVMVHDFFSELTIDQAAAAFTVSGGSYRLTSIEMAMNKRSGANNMRVSLVTDDGGKPGSVIEVISENEDIWPSQYPLQTTTTISSPTRPLLEDGNRYWILTEPTSTAASRYDWHSASPSVSGLFAQDTGYGEFPEPPWRWLGTSNNFVAYRVEGVEPAAPTDIQLSGSSVPENLPAGSLVGTFTTSDQDDLTDSFVYSLVSGAASSGNGSFVIDGDQLKTNAIFDYETQNTYSIRVRTTDPSGRWHEETFTLDVTNADEDFGDAPFPYATLAADNGAQHAIIAGGPFFGTAPDADADGQPTPLADGDDLAGPNVTVDTTGAPSFTPVSTAAFKVPIAGGASVIDGETLIVSNGVDVYELELDSNGTFRVGTEPVLYTDESTQQELGRELALAVTSTGISAIYSDGLLTVVDPDGDDENGVTFGSIQVGQLDASVTVNVQNAPSGAKLDAWIDFNGDGTWGSDDQIADSVQVTEGDNTITFDVPSSALSGSTYARFRLSTTGDLLPTGQASDGEVEDLAGNISPRGTLQTENYENDPDPNAALADATAGSDSSTTSVTQGGTIEMTPAGNYVTGVVVTDHPDVAGQVTATLTSPTSGPVTLTLTPVTGNLYSFTTDAFNGEDPNGDWTLTLFDNEVGDTGNLISWDLTIVTTASTSNHPNATGFALPDATAGVTTSQISVPDAIYINGVTVNTTITHTSASALTAELTSPQGTTIPITLGTPIPTNAFDTELSNGDWTLTIYDNVAGVTGTLDIWGLDISSSIRSLDVSSSINDAVAGTISSLLDFPALGGTITSVELTVTLPHANISDLSLQLSSPNSGPVAVTLTPTGTADEYEFTTTAFNTETTGGDWVLDVTDSVVGNTGTLQLWRLDITTTDTSQTDVPDGGPQAIPDATPGTTTSTITIPTAFIIDGLTLSVTFEDPLPAPTYLDELTITLEQVSTGIIVPVAPLTAPTTTLTFNDFDTQTADSDWILTIVDNNAGNAGVLDEWSLDVRFLVGNMNLTLTPIPDAQTGSGSSTTTISLPFTDTITSVEVEPFITGDLSQVTVSLTSPSGTVVSGIPASGLSVISLPSSAGTFGIDGGFNGEDGDGDWVLTATDSVFGGTHTLTSWNFTVFEVLSSEASQTDDHSLLDNVAVSIPDVMIGEVTSTITIGSGGSINGLTVMVDIDHPDTSQLVVTLTHPNGTDSVTIPNLSMPFTTTAFDGLDPAGVWTLTIQDVVFGLDGDLLQWGLSIDTEIVEPMPPVAVDDAYTVQEDSFLAVADAYGVATPFDSNDNGVLWNDTDDEGLVAEALLVAPPVHAQSFTLNADGTFSYLPELHFYGEDTFTYSAKDLQLTSDNVAIVTIFVLPFNDAPTDISLSNSSVAENQSVGAVVGSLGTTDPDAGDAHSYTLVTGSGDTDNTSFASDGDQLKTNAVFDYETQNTYSIRVRTTDSGGSWYEEAFGVTVTDVNEFLTLSIAADSIIENAGSAATTGRVTRNNTDNSAPLEVTLTNGDDTEIDIPTSVTIPADQASATFDIDALDDDEADIALSVTVTANAAGCADGSDTLVVNDEDEDGDGTSDDLERAAPNGGDGNNDGVLDNQQSNVVSLLNAADTTYMTLVAPDGTILNDVVSDSDPPSEPPADATFPIGFVEYIVEGVDVGASAMVTIYCESASVLNTYWKYGPTLGNTTPHWYPFMYDGTTGAKIFSDRIEVHFVDGARGDDDLTANGVIVDPGAPAQVEHPWQNPVLRYNVNNDALVSSLDVLALIQRINAGGLGQLPLRPIGDDAIPSFWDVSGDNQLSPVDVLEVIQHINTNSGGEGEQPQTLLHETGNSLDSNFGWTDAISSLGVPESSSVPRYLASVQPQLTTPVNGDAIPDPRVVRSQVESSPSREMQRIRFTESERANAIARMLAFVDDELSATELEGALSSIARDIAALWDAYR